MLRSLAIAFALITACQPSRAPSATPRSPDGEPEPDPVPSGPPSSPNASDPVPHGPHASPNAPPDTVTVPEPNPVPSEVNARYATDADAERWERRLEAKGREVHDRKDVVLAAVGIRPGERVADIGAGTGLFTLDFARAAGPNGKVFAVDVQDYFLAHIQKKASAARLTNIEFVLATQQGASLPPDSVDVAFLCDVYHHIEAPAAYLKSLRMALRPDGRLWVVDFDRTQVGKASWIHDHVRSLPEDFRREIEGAGFRFVRAHAGLHDNFMFEFHIAPGEGISPSGLRAGEAK